MRILLVLLMLLLSGLLLSPQLPIDGQAPVALVAGEEASPHFDPAPDVLDATNVEQRDDLNGGNDKAVAAADAPEAVPSPTTVPATVPAALRSGTSMEMALVELVNVDRTRQGLAPLAFDPSLLPIARARAVDQVPLSGLSHTDSAGRLAFAILLGDARLAYRLAGENLARLPGPEGSAPDRAEQALMNSPTHRANILESAFNRLAVGSALDSTGRIIFAQIFRAVR